MDCSLHITVSIELLYPAELLTIIQRENMWMEDYFCGFQEMPCYGHKIIVEHYLPEDLQFPDDPSHIQKANALQLLEFIQAWQVSHPDYVFQFSHWINDDGKFKEPVEEDNGGQSDASEPPPQKHKRKAHKGKECAKASPNVDLEEVGTIVGIHVQKSTGEVRSNIILDAAAADLAFSQTSGNSRHKSRISINVEVEPGGGAKDHACRQRKKYKRMVRAKGERIC